MDARMIPGLIVLVVLLGGVSPAAGAQAPPTSTAIIGDSVVTFTSDWHIFETTSNGIVLERGPAASSVFSYLELAAGSVPMDDNATLIESVLGSQVAGVQSAELRREGTLPDGTLWRVYHVWLGEPLLLIITGNIASVPGAGVVTSLLGDEDQMLTEHAAASADITVNGQPPAIAGIAPEQLMEPLSPATGDGTPAPTGRRIPVDRQTAGAPLDLAAMTLTPADLDAIGHGRYVLDSGETLFPDEMAGMIASYQGIPEREVLAMIDETGFGQRYLSGMILPGSAPGGEPAREVVSYVHTFDNVEGAATAFAFFEDESDDASAEDLPGFAGLGDASEATRFTGEGYVDIDVTIVLGNLHVGVWITGSTGEPPTPEEAMAMAEALLARAGRVLEDDGPGLGRQVVRLAGSDPVTHMDNYILLGGGAVRYGGETEEDRAFREGGSFAVGLTDEYIVWQQLGGFGGTADDDVWYTVSIQRFQTEAAAAEWVGMAAEDPPSDPPFGSVTVDTAVPRLGDQSVVYTAVRADGLVAYRSVLLRVGDTVAAIEIRAPQIPPDEVVVPLAQAQVTCLETGECPEPLPLPDAVTAFITSLDRTEPAPEATPGASPVPGSQPVGRVPEVGESWLHWYFNVATGELIGTSIETFESEAAAQGEYEDVETDFATEEPGVTVRRFPQEGADLRGWGDQVDAGFLAIITENDADTVFGVFRTGTVVYVMFVPLDPVTLDEATEFFRYELRGEGRAHLPDGFVWGMTT